MADTYNPPLALTIISSISIGVAAIISLAIFLDIIWRRGWKSMMGIMIPVYIVNALYLWPITLWVYLTYGRPTNPKKGEIAPSHCAHHPPHGHAGDQTQKAHETEGGIGDRVPPESHSVTSDDETSDAQNRQQSHQGNGSHCGHDSRGMSSDEEKLNPKNNSAEHGCHASQEEHGGRSSHNMESQGEHGCHGGGERPMFATLTVGVCHCGAGCVLGDIIGEWLVWGADILINGKMLWAEFLIDSGFAVLFGIFFQYFSIAPMAGEYGPKTIWRALKADILSLLFFEIGLFGWMAIFQIPIFWWKLEMNTATYWWMMQIGMFCGHWTAIPINYWLIKKKIKEPCC